MIVYTQAWKLFGLKGTSSYIAFSNQLRYFAQVRTLPIQFPNLASWKDPRNLIPPDHRSQQKICRDHALTVLVHLPRSRRHKVAPGQTIRVQEVGFINKEAMVHGLPHPLQQRAVMCILRVYVLDPLVVLGIRILHYESQQVLSGGTQAALLGLFLQFHHGLHLLPPVLHHPIVLHNFHFCLLLFHVYVDRVQLLRHLQNPQQPQPL